MKVPIKWLREFVPTDITTEEISHRMTMAGLEAESITHLGDEWDNVFVGVVERVSPHPNADRLVLATVDAGAHQRTVVTGAPNIKEGQKVAFAIVGARLIDPYADDVKRRTLKATNIRGIRSEGMVCSEKELGLSDEHEGILILENDAPLGALLRDYLGDDVIEFEITPNLVHAFSIQGIARELAAIVGIPANPLHIADMSETPRGDGRVTICEPELCGRYTLTLIEKVTIGPSPTWMQRRLIHAGLRPVNNWVDLSNYVMLEMGHPTHPFDADKLVSDDVIIRLAKPGESMETIDHIDRELFEDMLVIADKEKAIGIAGVIGGAHTEVDDSTHRILLESAWFDARTIRPTTRHLKVNTEASARFGRDIDPNGASVGADRIIELAKIVDPSARVVWRADQFPRPRERRWLSLRYSQIKRLLGMTIPLDDAVDILGRLEFEPSVNSQNGDLRIDVSVPTYRGDVRIEADLIEEVARIYGYETLPETLITGQTQSVYRDPARIVDQITQDALVEAGLFQVQTYTMVNENDLRALSEFGEALPEVLGGYPRPEVDFIRATNPLRSDWEIMRPTLIPSLLRITAENLKFNRRVAIFETARTYQPIGIDSLPDERRAVAIVLTGARDEFGLWNPESDEFDYFDVKGVIEALMLRLSTDDYGVAPVVHPSLHPGRSAALSQDGVQIGMLGELHPRVARRFGIESRTAVAEIDLETFALELLDSWSVHPIGTYQPIQQDFAIVVDRDVASSAVREAIQRGTGPLGANIELFDVYVGPGIEDGKKSLAYRVTLSAPDRQLSEREIESVRNRIERSAYRLVDGSLRS